MDAATYGLIGTVVGGLITIVVTLINNRKDLKIRQLEREAQLAEAKRIEATKERNLRVKRYATFLGSYHQVYGAFVDIIALLHRHQSGWSEFITEIIESGEFSKAIQTVNNGAGWIELLCRLPSARGTVDRLGATHDDLFAELRSAKTLALEGHEVDFERLGRKLKELDSLLSQLSEILRNDLSDD